MNESDEKLEEQTVVTNIFQVDYGEVCRLCMSTTRNDSTSTTMFDIHEDSIQFCDLAMAFTSVKVSQQ